jgi:hypothetical protein
VAEPETEHAAIGRPGTELTDPEGDGPDSVLVRIETRDRLAGDLADPVARVRSQRDIGPDHAIPAAKAGEVIGTREHDPSGSRQARRFIDVERSVDIDGSDGCPISL